MTDTITPEEVERLAKAATPGPWQTGLNSILAYGSCDTFGGPVLIPIGHAIWLDGENMIDPDGRTWTVSGDHEANAALIAAAPAMARLIATQAAELALMRKTNFSLHDSLLAEQQRGATQAAEIERLREALKPFAGHAEGFPDWWPDYRQVDILHDAAHYRAARAALEQEGG